MEVVWSSAEALSPGPDPAVVPGAEVPFGVDPSAAPSGPLLEGVEPGLGEVGAEPEVELV